MQATISAETEQQHQNLSLVFNETALKNMVKTFLGETTDRQVGVLFGYTDNSSWSLYKTGVRHLNTHIIARAMELFPGIPTEHYTVKVPGRSTRRS